MRPNIAGTGVVHQEPVMGTVVTFDVRDGSFSSRGPSGPPARR